MTSGMTLLINSTWDSLPIEHPISISLQWKDSEKAIQVKFEKHFYNDPSGPNHTAGATPKLYDYEVLEIFIANSNDQYVEIELGPHQQWLCLLLDGQRNSFNEGEYLQLSVWNRIDGDKWIGEADIPLAYLPANVSRINAYEIHNENGTRVYEAMNPTPYGKFKGPDFHRLDYFVTFDPMLVVAKEYFDEFRPYLDNRYGDLWAGHY
ncbi:hypothetical protein GCK32_002123 [Trichostrongylus colubriformis]|uniref:Uncharacterized protein n=1 Tax=Trichostrongylus colubriformis TaxID=6319 RepID=A0AAN8IHR4_TRICO